MNSEIVLNITPKASILKVFSRLNYKSWYAIAEFVDNSTQSFYNNERTMKFYNKHNITVNITYDSTKNILTITDNAYGMNIEDFKRAILLDSKPENTEGRNEFGMGLKTAASWFGNKWSVKSTRLGDDREYFAEIDINKIDKEELNSTLISVKEVPKEEHGTTIIISELTKEINSGRTLSRIKEILSGMYRRDIKSKKVKIYFNGEELFFEEYEPLKFRDQEWLKKLEFNFEYKGTTHKVNGFVGILAKGGYKKSGFALFRRNRVVIGGDDENYKPLQIFVQAQSQISLKLYGELNLDSFPVNQAKDGFVWDGGLEEKFIEVLKENIQDYIDIAKLSVAERTTEEEISPPVSEYVHAKVSDSLRKIKPIDNNLIEKKEDYNHIVEKFKELQEEDNIIKEPKTSNNRRYNNIIINKDKSIDLIVKWELSDNSNFFEYHKPSESDIGYITIHINHPFFKPYSKEDEFKIVMEKLIMALVVTEEKVRDHEFNGQFFPGTFRIVLNEILKTIS